MKSINIANKKVFFLFLIVFVCSTLSTFAQDEPTFEDDVVDNPPPTAPIDFWLLPMIILCLLYAYFFLKQHNFKLKDE
jgi:hypothetical protein